ncbi:MAG: translation initiation factor IF-3 [Deltaproteobacteria bacterium]|nr:translation initiation factor IF-3 [Deltaproteobacteria bacterium]
MGRHYRNRIAAPEPDQHRINHHIRISHIRLIGPDGEQLGIVSSDEGRAVARQHGQDLVEVAPDVRPPVCRIMDYGKYKYDQAKRATKSATTDVKTVQLRPKTDDHDLDTKLRRALKFLGRGDKVRLVMRMRGREQAYPQRWIGLLREHFKRHLASSAKIASPPSCQGRTITMLIEPDPA